MSFALQIKAKIEAQNHANQVVNPIMVINIAPSEENFANVDHAPQQACNILQSIILSCDTERQRRVELAQQTWNRLLN